MGMLLDGQRGLRSAMRKLTVLANTGGTCHFYLVELRVSQSLMHQVLPFFLLSMVEFLEEPSQNPGFQATNNFLKNDIKQLIKARPRKRRQNLRFIGSW